MEFLIRRGYPDDAEAIADVHIRTWQAAYRGQLPGAFLDGLSHTLARRTKHWRGLLNEPPPRTGILVADHQGEVIGFCSVGPSRDAGAGEEQGELYTIYVDPPWAGRGAGSVLIDHAHGLMAGMHYTAAILWVLTSNYRTRSFYERHGWRADGETKTEELPGTTLHETRYSRSFTPFSTSGQSSLGQ